MLVWYAFQFRYYLIRRRSRRWPSTTATIQKGAVTRVGGARAWAYGSFFGYVYAVRGVRYAGLFALIGNEQQGYELQEKLAGASIQVSYKPTDPNVSFVSDIYNPLFEGLTATQNPQWLDNYSGSRIPV